MRFPRLIGGIAAAALLVLAPLAPASAETEARAPSLNVTLLGDSYSAGNGAGSYEPGTESTSYRSTINWARNYVGWLNGQGVNTTFTNLAHSGHVTADLLAPGGQIDQMPTNTDLVMLTIGGNDIRFSTIVTQCFAAGARDARSCRESVESATAGLDGVKAETTKIFERLAARLQPGAQVVLVGYPLLSTTRSYELADCYARNWYGACTDHESYAAGTGVRELGTRAAQEQQALVAAWNNSNTLPVTFVNSVAEAFAGHEPDPSALSRNDYRWVNEFIETEGRLQSDGTTAGRVSTDTNNWYHPNVIGHEKIAGEVRSRLGVVSAAAAITGDEQDILFAVDTAAARPETLDAVRTNVRRLAADANGTEKRFALVSYGPGQSATVGARVEVGFTADPAQIEAGLRRALDPAFAPARPAEPALDWRPGVKNTAVVLDGSGSTMPEISERALERVVGSRAVEVYAVTEDAPVSAPLKARVQRSGGEELRTTDRRDLNDRVAEAIDAAARQPLGWVQGPVAGYTGETVMLDARASSARSGSIVRYDWDLDGDGVFDRTTTDGLIEHRFDTVIQGVVRVRVTALDGSQGVGSAPLSIGVAPAPVPEPAPVPDKPGVYEILDGGPLPFDIE